MKHEVFLFDTSETFGNTKIRNICEILISFQNQPEFPPILPFATSKSDW